MNPLDLASASAWDRVLFTTYALSLSFFEAVLMDRLVRGGTKQAIILADPDGVRSALSEQGARRAGRDYKLEPVAPTTGYFHPKVSLFEGAADCHMLIGSGNLTFGGWGHNLEVVEHLHPSFAADAFEDAADFFDLLAMDETVRMEARELCSAQAERLRRLQKGPLRGNIRLLHSTGAAIGSDLVGTQMSWAAPHASP